ncbi:homoserine O-acetyltransferase MetX [Verminephrobacter eiseniae]|uniref:homoserine O-acetyltransferase MetX n=1 Tax=Verminephrobacter eiseniae TaxID=364317 RepID=UPI002238F673|nr:homoserine O-acetyltransferase [Verminephrobacter eiseniae]
MEFIPKAARFMALPDKFRLWRGGTLSTAQVAYEAVGCLNASQDNVILIMPGLSPDGHVASHEEDMSPGWWEKMIGPGKPIDTLRWYVICVNPLGSCKGSTGPASLNPATSNAYRLSFPELSIVDIADAAAYVVRALGFKQLACVIGCSMGGMSSLALLARHPDLTRSHINISGAASALPFSIAVRSLQREIVQSDPMWNFGQYNQNSFPKQGMVMARKLGLISYRSTREWDKRFGRILVDSYSEGKENSFYPRFAVEEYLECQAQRFVHQFDPNCFLYLSRAIDRFDLGKTMGCTSQEALQRLQIENALVIGVDTDILFPLQQQVEIAEGLRASGANVQFQAQESEIGHDAFLVEINKFGRLISNFLIKISSVPPVHYCLEKVYVNE